MIETQNLTETELEQNYNEFIDLIKKSFKGDRLQKLLNLYSEDILGLRALISPASGKLNFHLARPGGYLIHIMHVINMSKGIEMLIKKMNGPELIDYTEEERIFAAMHHDLGKLGDESGEYYIPEENDWQIKNRKQMYKLNPRLQYFDVTDRSLYVLQQHNITTTWKEVLGIKLADGLYNEQNKKYFISYDEDFQLKTILPYVIHTADLLSCQTEYRTWKLENS